MGDDGRDDFEASSNGAADKYDAEGEQLPMVDAGEVAAQLLGGGRGLIGVAHQPTHHVTWSVV